MRGGAPWSQAAVRLKDASLQKLSTAEQARLAEHDRLNRLLSAPKADTRPPAVESAAVEDLLEMIFERGCEHQAQEMHRADSEARNSSQVHELQIEMQAEIEAKLKALREKALGIEQDVDATIRREKAAITAQHVDANLKLLEAMNLLQEQVANETAAAQERLALLEQGMQTERHHKEELLAAQLLAEEQHARDRETDSQKRKLFEEQMRALQEQVLSAADRQHGRCASFGCAPNASWPTHSVAACS